MPYRGIIKEFKKSLFYKKNKLEHITAHLPGVELQKFCHEVSRLVRQNRKTVVVEVGFSFLHFLERFAVVFTQERGVTSQSNELQSIQQFKDKKWQM